MLILTLIRITIVNRNNISEISANISYHVISECFIKERNDEDSANNSGGNGTHADNDVSEVMWF